MTHPPFPPNCDLIMEGFSGPVLCGLDEHGDYYSDVWARPIIAAVARCAWLDEAVELDVEAHRDPTKHNGLSIEACFQAAHQWKAWGEAK